MWDIKTQKVCKPGQEVNVEPKINYFVMTAYQSLLMVLRSPLFSVLKSWGLKK